MSEPSSSSNSSSSTPLAWASEAISASALETEGLALIQNLTHQHWTDYNDHDPGITTVEQLAYVLSDLSFRSVMPVSSLLAAEAAAASSSASSSSQSSGATALLPLGDNGILEYFGFHPWRTILTSAVVTPADWRKVLMNVPTVRNAWVTTPLSSSPSSSSSSSSAGSSSSLASSSSPGLPSATAPGASSSSAASASSSSSSAFAGYSVAIEQHPADLGGNLSDADGGYQINYLAANLLNWTRPLGDTFRVQSLLPRWIRIRLTVHLLPGAMVSSVQDAIIQRLIARIQPEPETIPGESVFGTTPTSASSASSVSSSTSGSSSSSPRDATWGELVDGPPLGYGFINERKLSHVQRRVTLRRGDLLKELLQPPIPGIAGLTDVAILDSPMLSLSSFGDQSLLPLLQRFAAPADPTTPESPLCSYVESKLSLVTRQRLQLVPPADSQATLDADTQQAIAMPLLMDLNTIINGPSLLSMGFTPSSSSSGSSATVPGSRSSSSATAPALDADLAVGTSPEGSTVPIQEINRLALEQAYPEIPRALSKPMDETTIGASEVFHFCGIQGFVVTSPPRGQPTRSGWNWATSPKGWNNTLTSHSAPLANTIPAAGASVTAYATVWNEFPHIYGIGEVGLPSPVPVTRQAQARQFQGYLALFDQLMADHTAQLGIVGSLFSWRPIGQTYATQLPLTGSLLNAALQVQGGLFYPSPLESSSASASSSSTSSGALIDEACLLHNLQAFAEPEIVFTARRERFLEHVLARYGRELTISPTESALRYRAQTTPALGSSASATSSSSASGTPYAQAAQSVFQLESSNQEVQRAVLRNAALQGLGANVGTHYAKFYLGFTPPSGIELGLGSRLGPYAAPPLLALTETVWCHSDTLPTAGGQPARTVYYFSVPLSPGKVYDAGNSPQPYVRSPDYDTVPERDVALDIFAHRGCLLDNYRLSQAPTAHGMEYRFDFGAGEYRCASASDRYSAIHALAAACEKYVFITFGPTASSSSTALSSSSGSSSGTAVVPTDTAGMPGYDRPYSFALYDGTSPTPFLTSNLLDAASQQGTRGATCFDRATAWRSLEALLDCPEAQPGGNASSSTSATSSSSASAPAAGGATSSLSSSSSSTVWALKVPAGTADDPSVQTYTFPDETSYDLARSALPVFRERFPFQRLYLVEHPALLSPLPPGSPASPANARITVVVAGDRWGIRCVETSLISCLNSLIWEYAPAHLGIEILWLWGFDLQDVASVARSVLAAQDGVTQYLLGRLNGTERATLSACANGTAGTDASALTNAKQILAPLVDEMVHGPPLGYYIALPPTLAQAPAQTSNQELLALEFPNAFVDTVSVFTPLYRQVVYTARIISTLPEDIASLANDRLSLSEWLNTSTLDRYVEAPPIVS
jgi:hypothetical protein